MTDLLTHLPCIPLSAVLSLPGTTYADLDLFAEPGVCCDVIDLGYPEVREVVRLRAGQDGEEDETEFVGGRVVSIRLTLFPGAADPAAVLDLLGPFCVPKRRPLLTYQLEGQDERQVTLRASQRSNPIGMPGFAAIPVQVQWRGAAALESATLQTADVFPFDPTQSGLAFPWVFPLVFTGSGSTVITITNAGDLSAAPVSIIRGPVVNPKLANDTTGQTLEFTNLGGLSLAGYDYLEVDHRQRTVRLNGSAAPGDNLYRYLDFAASDWWVLEPGDNLIRYYPASGGDLGVQVSWRSAYI